ncbi:PedC/BrcD family bacteriocin maturation disulfide isomerase [Clostridium beijerinckii]|uniref:PedC/BrcD family bacteriocin maturation disulfide isomerase n=1 Tax=Clostridium beijerinckii TaxID=1520 RepID=UPI002225C0B0|nr:PedC/BrcD family bacteriocin maturation disulfide isomerase [Clostridium beijerinckii]UYZ35872.1 PedC/BrcD family bacteriocin maturation disulfide isomerase [Clostridium beijerinckii]
MKKSIVSVAILTLMCSFLVGIGGNGVPVYAATSVTSSKTTSTVTELKYEKNIKGVHKISLRQYLDKVHNGEKFIVFIGFKECSHCRNFSPIMKKFLKNVDQRIYYLDYGPTGTFKNASKEEINDFYDTFTTPYQFGGTPTVALFSKGKVISMTVGDNTTLDDLNHLVSDSEK